MRFAVAALCVLALTGSANADFILKGHYRAPCKMLPPLSARQEPNVPYSVVTWPQARLQRTCAAGNVLYQPVTACAAPPKSGIGNWLIIMPSFESPSDYACTLMYEKAHLPPNNWKDQAWEDQAFKNTPYVKRQSAPVSP